MASLVVVERQRTHTHTTKESISFHLFLEYIYPPPLFTTTFQKVFFSISGPVCVFLLPSDTTVPQGLSYIYSLEQWRPIGEGGFLKREKKKLDIVVVVFCFLDAFPTFLSTYLSSIPFCDVCPLTYKHTRTGF